MIQWTLAECEKLRAFDFMGRLVITAEGHKPTPCHVVRIMASPLLIYPPQFLVQWEQRGMCIEVLTPYHVASRPYIWPSGKKTVKVAHLRAGEVATEDVPVEVVRTFATSGGGGGVPSPFAVDSGAESRTAPQGATDTAIGYSDSFSFEEAFQDAITNLPKRQPSHPDELVRITVTKTGAEMGGIAGFHHLFVEIERRVL